MNFDTINIWIYGYIYIYIYNVLNCKISFMLMISCVAARLNTLVLFILFDLNITLYKHAGRVNLYAYLKCLKI